MDDPQHAAGALEAARALSKIAPDAGHAQHMCSHIFMALGMWDDVVQANLAAMSVVNRQRAAAGKPSRTLRPLQLLARIRLSGTRPLWRSRKSGRWLPRGGSESGMAARARGTVDPDNAHVGSFAEMRSRYIVDTGRWNGEVAGWNVDLGGAKMPEFNSAFATGFAAAELGDVAAARESLGSLGRLLTQLPALFDHEGLSADDPDRRVPEIQKVQIEAVILSAEGHGDQAIASMQQAVATGKDLPYAFGPPSPEKPSDELLGELLLKANKAPQAREAFEASLKRAPRRAESLLGLARAESAMGDKAAAANSYGELLRDLEECRPGLCTKRRGSALCFYPVEHCEIELGHESLREAVMAVLRV